MLLIVLLDQDDRVFSLRHIKVVGYPVHTEGICLQSHSPCALGQGVGVYGDEEVGLVAVGNVGSLMERDKDVGFACVYDFHLWAVVLHESSEGERHVEVDILLLGESAKSACVMTSMSGVDDERETLLGCHCHSEREYQHYRSYNPSVHIPYYIISCKISNKYRHNGQNGVIFIIY